MNIQNNKEVFVFRNDYQGKSIYNIGLSKKRQDGTYENGTIKAQFRNGVELHNKTKIRILSAWLTFYKTKENKNGKEVEITVPYIFVNDFEVNTAIELQRETKPQIQPTDDDYAPFGESITLDGDDLPW